MPFLFGVYPGLTSGTQNIADGNLVSNRFTLYQTDADPRLSPAEWRLNADVLRVSRTARPSDGLSGVPRVDGRPRVPVMSLHTIGDLFVPFSMEQIYAKRAALHGRSGLFVSRAIRALGHWEFAAAELRRASPISSNGCAPGTARRATTSSTVATSPTRGSAAGSRR